MSVFKGSGFVSVLLCVSSLSPRSDSGVKVGS